MVGTYRDNELPPRHPLLETLADLERDRPLARLHLHGLDERRGRRSWSSATGTAPEPRSARSATETGGNPFFVKQLVRHLEEGGDRRRAPPASGVPEGLRDVIARRVARLPEHGERVLRIAALIGRDFDLTVLERVADLPEDDLLDALDAAVRAGLLVGGRRARPAATRSPTRCCAPRSRTS